ncbi:hypothetical protein B566_EDAN015547 [Ephemera danica]|nr:hypothetical protein B566_EDAN015547 [Ephemera danica]
MTRAQAWPALYRRPRAQGIDKKTGSGKSQIPLYEVLNIQIKGYDYAILESHQKFVHMITTSMGLDVEDGWATPPQNFHIQKYKPQSTVVDGDYKLSIYERNIQVVDVPTTVFPILLSVLAASSPEGVTLNVHEHQPEHEEIRYVPDLELKQLKTQLDTMGGPSKQRK